MSKGKVTYEPVNPEEELAELQALDIECELSTPRHDVIVVYYDNINAQVVYDYFLNINCGDSDLADEVIGIAKLRQVAGDEHEHAGS